jgi:hypothetical protein
MKVKYCKYMVVENLTFHDSDMYHIGGCRYKQSMGT